MAIAAEIRAEVTSPTMGELTAAVPEGRSAYIRARLAHARLAALGEILEYTAAAGVKEAIAHLAGRAIREAAASDRLDPSERGAFKPRLPEQVSGSVQQLDAAVQEGSLMFDGELDPHEANKVLLALGTIGTCETLPVEREG